MKVLCSLRMLTTGSELPIGLDDKSRKQRKKYYAIGFDWSYQLYLRF